MTPIVIRTKLLLQSTIFVIVIVIDIDIVTVIDRDMTNTIEEWPREFEQSLLFHGVPVPDNESFYTKVLNRHNDHDHHDHHNDHDE